MTFLEDIVCPLKTVEKLKELNFEIKETKFYWVKYLDGRFDIFAAPTVDGMLGCDEKTIDVIGPAYLAEELGQAIRPFQLPQWNNADSWYVACNDSQQLIINGSEDIPTPINEADARAQLLIYMIQTKQIVIADAHKIKEAYEAEANSIE